MNMHLKKNTVIFDMDGVIVDSMKYHAIAWISVLKKYGLNLTEIDIFKREGMTGLSSIKDIFIEKQVDMPDEDEFTQIVLEKNRIFKTYSINLYPLMEKIISELKKSNITIGLVTGSPRIALNHILSSDFITFFDTIITGDDVNKGKPDPEPYLKAIKNLRVAKEDVIVVENAPMGILSAKRAGLYCIAIQTTLPDEYLTDSDKIIHTHNELFEILPGLSMYS